MFLESECLFTVLILVGKASMLLTTIEEQALSVNAFLAFVERAD